VCVGKEIGDEGPGHRHRGVDRFLTGFQDAHGGGIGRRALLGPGAVEDAPGDDGVAPSAFGLVVGVPSPNLRNF
jgi:hypothetical protein